MEKPFTVFHDFPYGSHERHKLDIFIPKNPKSSSGVILFIHGGGWSDGDKSVHSADCEYFCNLGYVCGTMNYRFVSEEINVYHELDDISGALKSIKQKCAEFGLSPEKLILSGVSAGAHLSLLYAYTKKDDSPINPVAACVYCPPVSCWKSDFLLGISGEFEDWKYGLLSKCCGIPISRSDFQDELPQKHLRKMSPDGYVSENCVPTALFHGKNDNLIPPEHIHVFMAALKDAGVKNDLLIYENSDHALKDDPHTADIARDIFRNYVETYF